MLVLAAFMGRFLVVLALAAVVAGFARIATFRWPWTAATWALVYGCALLLVVLFLSGVPWLIDTAEPSPGRIYDPFKE